MTTAAPFKNQHLSYSRLSRFEQCPLSFKLHYIDKKTATPGVELRFGKVVHSALEVLLRWLILDEVEGAIPPSLAIQAFQGAWTREQLSGASLFSDGVEMMAGFVRDQGVLDSRRVLGVEKEFTIQVGRFSVLGYMDRIDLVDDETVVRQMIAVFERDWAETDAGRKEAKKAEKNEKADKPEKLAAVG